MGIWYEQVITDLTKKSEDFPPTHPERLRYAEMIRILKDEAARRKEPTPRQP